MDVRAEDFYFNTNQVCARKFFNDDAFSDVVIRCGEREFKAHRVILANLSPVFYKMLRDPWKEDAERVVNIDDLEPSVVEAMLCFMYTHDYDAIEPPADIPPLTFLVKLYRAADKYYIYQFIPQLQWEFYRAITCEDWPNDQLFSAIIEVYMSTRDEDRALRDSVIQACTCDIDVLQGNAKFREILKTFPAFAVELLSALTEEITHLRSQPSDDEENTEESSDREKHQKAVLRMTAPPLVSWNGNHREDGTG